MMLKAEAPSPWLLLLAAMARLEMLKAAGNPNHDSKTGRFMGSARIAPVELHLVGWSGSASNLSALARRVYAEDLQGTTVENASLNAAVAFTSEGKGEAFGAKGKIRHPIRAELVRALRELVARAVKVSEAAPNKSRASDSKAFHTLVSALRVDGELHAVRVTVRESRLVPDGQTAHKFYDVAQIQIKGSPDADGVASSISAGPVHPGTVGASGVMVSELAQAFNLSA